MAETTWTYNLLDFYPIVIYSATPTPAIVPGLVSAWQQSCPTGNSANLGDTICDLSSIHTTTTSGASVTIPFHGQEIQLFGSATNGMTYTVTLDDATPGSGNATAINGNTLAHLTNLVAGDHTVTLSAQPGTQAGATLSFTSATVTVGTGLTGATVTRQNIQDDDSSIDYIGGSSWTIATFDTFSIPHTSSNSTWHQLNAGNPGSFSITATGAKAMFAYGVSWSFFSSDYRVSIDSATPTLYYGNSSLANPASMGAITADSLRYFNANLNGTHTITIDNNNGLGQLANDYIQLVSVTGGTPLGASSTSHTSGASGTSAGSSPTASGVVNASISSNNSKTIAGATVGAVLGVIALLGLFFFFFRRHKRQISNPGALPHNQEEKFMDSNTAHIVPFTAQPTSFDPYAQSISGSSIPYTERRSEKGAVITGNSQRIPISSPRSEKDRARLATIGSIGSDAAMSEFTTSPGMTSRALSPVGVPPQHAERVRQLELALAQARATAGTDTSSDPGADEDAVEEIRALRRDLNNLLQLIDNNRATGSDMAPPMYA